MEFKVGDLYRTKREIFGKDKNVLGVCVDVYDTGISILLETGNYDGFAIKQDSLFNGKSEIEFMLEKVGHCDECSDYGFRSLNYLMDDFKKNRFVDAFSDKYKQLI